MTDNNDKPSPGSAEAQANGCRCPVMDNCRGRGANETAGQFWINGACPLHGGKQEPVQ